MTSVWSSVPNKDQMTSICALYAFHRSLNKEEEESHQQMAKTCHYTQYRIYIFNTNPSLERASWEKIIEVRMVVNL